MIVMVMTALTIMTMIYIYIYDDDVHCDDTCIANVVLVSFFKMVMYVRQSPLPFIGPS